ncbi:MAG: hypothetical protein CM1200mP20_13710 [Pseudomonadota bacterium]|nr:MAG: hypothetical protein CM1200mP20_13710 [Pseudomonadota bacterium]
MNPPRLWTVRTGQMIDCCNVYSRNTLWAYLFISHDLRVVRALSDQIIVMRRGQVVEQGLADTLFPKPAHPYTRALMSAAFDLTVSDETVIPQ